MILRRYSFLPLLHCLCPFLLFLLLLPLSNGAYLSMRSRDESRPRGKSASIGYSQGQLVLDHGGNGHSSLPHAATADAGADDGLDVKHGLPSALLDALETMQSRFFEIWQGTWPKAIDWTAAVMGTQVSASLAAVSASANCTSCENLINGYFTQLVAYYFGEDAFSLRGQAYDDMLWVVLGWLEAIKFINTHSDTHFSGALGHGAFHPSPGQPSPQPSHWYAKQFIPSFAHRARIFYDLASQGWDTSLCDGGMIWSPYLTPYKNAITNQLYIAASVSMYLHFPGDDIRSPFLANKDDGDDDDPPAEAHDTKYLKAAVGAYEWLVGSNMTNSNGLYVDGFHIRGWRGGRNGSKGSGKCDERDEKVYTYNQGVLLTGLRGLWEATGTQRYLDDGHDLINNVITATGWYVTDPNERRMWAGIGRSGVLEEACDSTATCSQNGQTFKGIFFHHLDVFCAPLPPHDDSATTEKSGILFRATRDLVALHDNKCSKYRSWIEHNARAAYGTRDEDGRYGTWWTWGLLGSKGDELGSGHLGRFDDVPDEGTDYRNRGVPDNDIWRLPPSSGGDNTRNKADASRPRQPEETETHMSSFWDPNSRGRGRTVETQSGGLAVLRAAHGFIDRRALGHL